MTVRELIEKLRDEDQDMEVFIAYEGVYAQFVLTWHHADLHRDVLLLEEDCGSGVR